MDKRNKDYPKYIIELKNTKTIAQHKKKLEKIGINDLESFEHIKFYDSNSNFKIDPMLELIYDNT